jgi:hypothetical protein
MRGSGDWTDRSFSRHEKLGLGFEIVSAYARARWCLWRTDLPRTVATLREHRFAEDEPADRERAGLRLGWVVGRTLRHLPFDSRCLMRSLVLTSLLARRGIASDLVIAVHPESGLEAHAWVESRGVPLLPPADPPFRRMVEI